MAKKLIIIDGPMGSGKTVLSKKVQEKLGRCALLSVDRIKNFIYDFHGANKSDKDFSRYDVTSMISQAYLKHGFDVVIEKSLGDKETIEKIVKISKIKGTKVFVFKVDAPLKVRMRRVVSRDKPKRSELKKLKVKIEKDALDFSICEVYDYDCVFDSSTMTLEEISKKIISRIK